MAWCIRFCRVSIHASAREATLYSRSLTGTPLFQSTPPHGRRHQQCRRGQRPQCVSIHASAREATSPLYPSNLAGLVFQSTPPHGRRPGKKWQRMVVSISFNPRLRTGGDDFVKVRVRGEFPFQSTPPHGRRPYILTPQ